MTNTPSDDTHAAGYQGPGYRSGSGALLVAACVLLTLTAQFNYLLFHVLVELFAVIVGLVMGVVAVYTRGYSRNDYLTLLGIAYPAVALLDLVHTLAYKGMGVFPDGANLPTQFWIAARALEATVLALAPYYLDHPLRRERAIGAVVAFTLGLFLLIGFGAFPTMYIEGRGLTPAKIAAEYAIIALLALAAFRLWQRRHLLDAGILRLMAWALALTAAAEIFFTVYVGVYDISNLVGHLAKLLSFVLVFIALVRTSLRDPFRILSRHSSTYDAIPEEILVVDTNGAIRQVNRLVEERFHNVDLLDQHCHAPFHPADLSPAACPVCQAIAAGKRASFELYYPQDASWRLISLAPFGGHEIVRGMVQTIRDITELRKTQVELKRVDRALHAISASNQTLIHARDEKTLMQEICALMVELGGYSMAWIGFGETLPNGERRLIPQAWAGAEQGYLGETTFAWDDTPLAQGPAGSAMRTGQIQIANNLATSPSYAPWREAALRRGFAATMAFPLAVPGGQPLGVLVVYSSEPDVFTAEESSVLGELAGDVAFGITALRNEQARATAEQEAEHWYRQVAGVFRETVEALSQLVEMRDPYTAGHQQRVALWLTRSRSRLRRS